MNEKFHRERLVSQYILLACYNFTDIQFVFGKACLSYWLNYVLLGHSMVLIALSSLCSYFYYLFQFGFYLCITLLGSLFGFYLCS